MTVTISLVGAGAIGRIHARSIAASPSARIGNICDMNREAAASLTATFGGSASSSLEEVLAAQPDGVIIGSSTASHGAVAEACIAAGIPFLCEKPLASTQETALSLVKQAEENGVAGYTAFNRRFDAQYSGIRAAVKAGAIGKLESLSLVSRTVAAPTPEFIRTSGGLFGEKGSHFYDLCRWVTGEHPVEIFAMGSVLIDPRFAEIGEVDTAMLTLRMPSGILCHLDFSWRAAYGQDERMEAHGSEGMLQTRQDPVETFLRFTETGVRQAGKMPTWQERFAPTYPAELEAFAASLRGEGPGDLPSLRDGLAAQMLADAARESLRANKPIALDPLP